MPVIESKAADVFAFGMLAVEVFTGKVPFGGKKDEAVLLLISNGGRPEMPPNAQEVGLTAEMWNVVESCWKQNPNKRPTMQEVAKKWQRFVENDASFPSATFRPHLKPHSQLPIVDLGSLKRRLTPYKTKRCLKVRLLFHEGARFKNSHSRQLQNAKNSAVDYSNLVLSRTD